MSLTLILTIAAAIYLTCGFLAACWYNLLMIEIEGSGMKVWQFLLVMVAWPLTFLP